MRLFSVSVGVIHCSLMYNGWESVCTLFLVGLEMRNINVGTNKTVVDIQCKYLAGIN